MVNRKLNAVTTTSQQTDETARVVNKPKIPRDVLKFDKRAACAIMSTIAFLQRTCIPADVKTIKACISQRCRKPNNHILENLQCYLTAGIELGILQRRAGLYKIGNFEIRKRKKKSINNTDKQPTIGVPTTGEVLEKNPSNVICQCAS